ncbi:MAG: protelomerase family protein [Aliarcobacter sp.]|nr:protelomerase family protein [Aliarcobacter sp.]
MAISREDVLSMYTSKTNKEVIEKLVNDLKKSSNLIEVYNKYLPFLWHTDTSFYTVRNKYQEVKEEINNTKMKKSLKNDCLSLFTLNEEFFNLLNKSTKINNDEKVKEQQLFSLDNYIKTIQKVKEDFLSNDFEKFKYRNSVFLKRNDEYIKSQLGAIYLALITGRRQAEIFISLDISKHGKKVFFDDLLKKREGQETRIEAFLIENDYKTAKEALNTIRANYKLTDPKEMNNIKKSVNTFIKEYLEDENISYSLIRDMYVKVATETLKPKNMADEYFKSLILGHDTGERSRLGSHYDKTRAV